ncbi:MAG TPA: hypothetical protein PK987_07600 [Ferruginibacter sp.]|nr:hypothetical protein [Ferruginibacter sp.]
MDIKKLFLGGIAGGVAFFLLGWLIYGILLANFMSNHTGTAGNLMRADGEILFLYLIIGTLAQGFFLAYIFLKANINKMPAGFITGAIVGLLLTISFDCIAYATSTMISKTAMAVDVVAETVLFAIAGAIVAMVLGMGKKTA